ncbi:hypothetical protein [Pseudoclavibacter helvolus]|uniref:hypothetical protein n=1 Tax=Pseudoclavibacter helvolus TaxID=255205 RepID=UPI0012E94977|nr:hypothetical protein [Pseudoclavibacter helvolus]
MSTPATSREAAHVLLDAVTVTEVSPDAAALAYDRLVEVGAFVVKVEQGQGLDADLDPDAEQPADGGPNQVKVNIELSNLLHANYMTLDWLIEELAHARNTTRDDIIIALREHLDSVAAK